MKTFLTILSGLGWIIVYEECIRLGFKQKTYAMPFFALGLNIAWEAIYTSADIFLGAHGPLEGITMVQAIVNVFWVMMDAVMLFTYFKFGRKWWPKSVSVKWFVPWSLLVLAACVALQLGFIKEFGFTPGDAYSAFLQNLLMSILFISMFARRGGSEGQSLLLAIAKWIGTLAPTITFGVLGGNSLVLVVGALCSVFDLVYIGLLICDRRKININLDVTEAFTE